MFSFPYPQGVGIPCGDKVGGEGVNLSWLRGTVRVKTKLLNQSDPAIPFIVLATE